MAFSKSATASLGTEKRPGASGAFVAAASGAGHSYLLADGKVLSMEDAFAPAIVLPKKETTSFAIVGDGADVRLYTIDAADGPLRLRRYTSADAGKTYAPASEKLVWDGPTAAGPIAVAMTSTRAGMLFVAIGKTTAGAFSETLARLDVRTDPVGAPEAWTSVEGSPSSLSFDEETGDLWATYRALADGSDALYRTRVEGPPRTEPLRALRRNDRPERVSGNGVLYRGKAMPRLAGKYVYDTPIGLAVVDPFGPSGPASVDTFMVPKGPLASDRDGELFVAEGGSLASLDRVVDTAPPIAAPASLLATKCFDVGAPSGVVGGAIAYDVATPLWSDGASKERFVVVPRGARIRSRPDGDLLFPIGTVAVKSFSVDGRRVETRLLVQHEVDDWVGYSYQWKADGSDATLVAGNRTVELAGGKRWYYPSTSDCGACHTPAAGYTLGLETKQLVGKSDGALSALDAKTDAPVARGSVKPLTAGDARSYLHANCSSCHREGSVAGAAQLDLRFDTALADTGLCNEPKLGDLGAKGARLVTPGAPERSVIVLRMRATDERRMPKLGTRIVDDAGVAAVEAWIKSLASCP